MSRELSPALKKLMAQFGEKLPEKLAEIRQLHEATSDASSADELKEYHTAVHRIAGSSGSYGFPEVSLAARELDRYLSDVVAGEKSYAHAEAADLLALVDAKVSQVNQAG